MDDQPDPEIAAVIAAHEAATQGILAQDVERFLANAAPELVVNSPGDRVLPLPGVRAAFAMGLIDYAEHRTIVEHAARRPNGEIVLMGHELVVPRGKSPGAGATVTYRFTEVWRPEGGDWLLSLRHATVRAAG